MTRFAPLTAVILSLLLATTAKALDIGIGSANVAPGNPAIVSVTFENVGLTPISSFALHLTVSSAFASPTVSPGNAQPNLTCFVDNFGGGDFRVTGLILDGSAITNGDVATLTFAVPPGTAPGPYPISFAAAPPISPANPEVRALISSSLIAGTASGGVINVVPAGEPATITGITPQPGSVFLLEFAGTAGAIYGIEAATNLVSPPTAIDWLRITNLTAGLDGLFQFIDDDAAVLPQRFYRAVNP